jgi:hypothetical protein
MPAPRRAIATGALAHNFIRSPIKRDEFLRSSSDRSIEASIEFPLDRSSASGSLDARGEDNRECETFRVRERAPTPAASAGRDGAACARIFIPARVPRAR